MITPMDTYSFVLHHTTSQSFLDTLQEFGLVDITRSTKSVDGHSKALYERLQRFQAAQNVLNSLPVTKKGKEVQPVTLPYPVPETSQALLEAIENALSQKAQLTQSLQALNRLEESTAVWGHFRAEDRERLQALGYTLHAYVASEKRFDPDWTTQYPLIEINRNRGSVYFLLLQKEGEPLTFALPEIKFPDQDIRDLHKQVTETENQIQALGAFLDACKPQVTLLDAEIQQLYGQFELYVAGQGAQKEAEDCLTLLSGFAPQSQRQQIHDFLEASPAIYLRQEAKEEDEPPVKLKNNIFARLYEPIGSLYMLPKYGELDLTPYFAPFYMAFFGMCVGDIGYGLVLLLAGTIVKRKLPQFKGYAALVQFLGLGAAIMACLTGTFFGMELASSPILPAAVKNAFLSSIELFWFAILFGILHIIVARLVSAFYAIRHKGWQHGLSNIGWSALLVWACIAYASGSNPALQLPSMVTYIWVGISLVLIVGFSKITRNIFARLGMGTVALWDITSLFGDILSYIRLFGLATSGGILGMVINSLAEGMFSLPYVGWLAGTVMLLIGHSAVLALACIGAFVHPMRLTFVEFYKNAGFSGGGREFRPLTKKIKE
jgi:Archaeal/vacuolar-type H+-ATPase subunit I